MAVAVVEEVDTQMQAQEMRVALDVLSARRRRRDGVQCSQRECALLTEW